MTVQTDWFDWVDSGLDWDTAPYESPSPNLLALLEHLTVHAGGRSLGIEYDRPIRNGVKPSEHSWGAALDWGWGRDPNPLDRAAASVWIDWIVAHSAELGICAIIDERRSWRPPAWRDRRRQSHVDGWIPYNSGYDGWCHIVTTYDKFADDTPVADRLTPPPPPREDPTMPPIAVVHDPVLLGDFALIEGRWVCWPRELAAVFPATPRVEVDHEFLREQILDHQGPDATELWRARAVQGLT